MRFRNLQSWLDWQETLHPEEIELGLDRIRQVWHSLYQSEFKPVVISVAGTNGKGSCCAMLESIYLAAGYRTGCYTSPHFIRYTERIRIHGEEVSEDDLCEVFEAIDQARGDISLTYFEFGTLAALLLFARSSLEVVILEVGLGGRLDAVNIIDADVSLLSSVGLDHQAWLGEDRETIGREKAGIFRPGKTAICAESDPPASVLQYAREMGVNCLVQGKDFYVQTQDHGWSWHGPGGQSRYSLPVPSLRGAQQVSNASAVLMVVQTLEECLPVNMSHIRHGLTAVMLPGRFQVIAGDVPIILDVAHNPAAANVLRDNLQAYNNKAKTHAVCGMLADKDITSVMETLSGVIDDWYLVPIKAARGAGYEQLTEALSLEDRLVHKVADVPQALDLARQQARAGEQILVFGSFYVVADALKHLHE